MLSNSHLFIMQLPISSSLPPTSLPSSCKLLYNSIDGISDGNGYTYTPSYNESFDNLEINKSLNNYEASYINFITNCFRFPFLMTMKIVQRLRMNPLKRFRRLYQNRSPTCVFRAIWILAFLMGEILIFHYAMIKCAWPDNIKWVIKINSLIN